MAAALRHAAAMRRAVLISPEQQRRLLSPRLAHTTACPDVGDIKIKLAYRVGRMDSLIEELAHRDSHYTQSCTDAKVRLAYLSGRIDARKEELYNLISEIQSYNLPRKVSKGNAQLLATLSAQIEPRIDDPLWFRSRRARRLERFYTCVGNNTILFLAAAGTCVLIPLVEDPALDWWNKRKKLALAWWKKQLK